MAKSKKTEDIAPEVVETPAEEELQTAPQYGKDQIDEMFAIITDNLVPSAKAAELIGIQNAHFRTLLRRETEGVKDITTYKIGNTELFLVADVVAFREKREAIKREAQEKREKTGSGRKTELLNLNMLRVLAQNLGVQYSKLNKEDLKAAVADNLSQSVEGDLDLASMDFTSLMTLVAEVMTIRAGAATEEAADDDVIIEEVGGVASVDDMLAQS